MGSNPTLTAILRQGFGWQAIREIAMWYVYILKSRSDEELYIGSTADLKRRINEHNHGRCDSTRTRRPFELEAYVAVRLESTARELEKYLKSGSGRATLAKRILAAGARGA